MESLDDPNAGERLGQPAGDLGIDAAAFPIHRPHLAERDSDDGTKTAMNTRAISVISS
jgi:hypothetical protein